MRTRSGGTGAPPDEMPSNEEISAFDATAVSRSWRTTIGAPATPESLYVSTRRTPSLGIHLYMSASFEPKTVET